MPDERGSSTPAATGDPGSSTLGSRAPGAPAIPGVPATVPNVPAPPGVAVTPAVPGDPADPSSSPLEEGSPRALPPSGEVPTRPLREELQSLRDEVRGLRKDIDRVIELLERRAGAEPGGDDNANSFTPAAGDSLAPPLPEDPLLESGAPPR